MFESCVIRGRTFTPARFAGPLAGFTHSAMRRLVAGFGGYGAIWTEMLAGRQILGEQFSLSPWLKRRPEEGFVFFQLMLRDGDPVDRIMHRMADEGVEAVDINLACDAMSIRATEAGSALFEKMDSMGRVLNQARKAWNGILTAKIRLGSRGPKWQAGFIDRLRVIEDAGLDAVTLHPRFFEDKFRGTARLELIPWAAALTRLPLIANGDITGPDVVERHKHHLAPAAAIMLGRMAIAQPWLFASWNQPLQVNHGDVFRSLTAYIVEDFQPAIALRRIKMFAQYFAANFAFGHPFWVDISKAVTVEDALARANDFFSRSPQVLKHPIVAGL